MTERTWEIEAPSLAITVRWGDTILHTAHLDPPRSFFLGGASADCVLPDHAVGPGRIPLVLAERGALYLVLHPSMDPDGAITAPGRAARTVADLARAGMAQASPDVPGAFLVELVPGMTAALAIDDFTIAIALETKSARAVAGHYHVGRRMIPFQIGSAALHLALLAVTAFFTGPTLLASDGPSEEQLCYIQQALQVVAEKEMEQAETEQAATAREERLDFRPRNQESFDPRRFSKLPMESASYSFAPRNPATARPDPRAPAQSQRSAGLFADESIVDEQGFNAAIDPRTDRYSTFALDVDAVACAKARRLLEQPRDLPAPSSVRPEELLNSFDYRYPGPVAGASSPFAVHLAAAPSPFAAGHHVLRVGVQGRRIATSDRAPSQPGGAPEIIAHDVEIQVDFNPDAVRSYRLVGHESRGPRDVRRRWDNGDAEVIRAGHSVTAVYDVVLATTASSPVTVRIHHRLPLGLHGAQESVFVMAPRAIAPTFEQAPSSLRLAATIAGFAEVLRKSSHAGEWHLADVERVALALVPGGPGVPGVPGGGADGQAQELAALVGAAGSLDDARVPSTWRGRIADASLMGF